MSFPKKIILIKTSKHRPIGNQHTWATSGGWPKHSASLSGGEPPMTTNSPAQGDDPRVGLLLASQEVTGHVLQQLDSRQWAPSGRHVVSHFLPELGLCAL